MTTRRRDADPVEGQQPATIAAKDLNLHLTEGDVPIRADIPSQRVIRISGNGVPDLDHRALDESDRAQDVGERTHAVHKGEGAHFHRGIVRIIHPVNHVHERGAGPHGRRHHHGRRRSIGQGRGSHGAAEKGEEQGFHGIFMGSRDGSLKAVCISPQRRFP